MEFLLELFLEIFVELFLELLLRGAMVGVSEMLKTSPAAKVIRWVIMLPITIFAGLAWGHHVALVRPDITLPRSVIVSLVFAILFFGIAVVSSQKQHPSPSSTERWWSFCVMNVVGAVTIALGFILSR